MEHDKHVSKQHPGTLTTYSLQAMTVEERVAAVLDEKRRAAIARLLG